MGHGSVGVAGVPFDVMMIDDNDDDDTDDSSQEEQKDGLNGSRRARGRGQLRANTERGRERER
jgi:hypothetical protein